MKIKVKNLKPNPFRALEKYPIDSYKVDALVNSIKETSFWDNILVRPADNGFFEIAYGHHRLLAIQKVGLETIDVPVRELDDDTMIQIMANENLEQWGSDPIVKKESVRVARDRLDSIIKNINDFNKLSEPTFKIKNVKKEVIEIIRKNYKRKENFNAIRQKIREGSGHVGQPLVKSFLGKNWSDSSISEALAQLKESKEMQEAEEQFETQAEAQEFRKSVKQIEKEGIKIPEKKKKKIAKQVATARKVEKGKKKKGEKTDRHDYRKDIKTKTRAAVEGISEKRAKLKDIEAEIKRFDDRVRSAYIGTRDLNLLLKELEIKKLEGLKSIFVLDNVSELLRELKKTLRFFGYDYKHLQIGG